VTPAPLRRYRFPHQSGCGFVGGQNFLFEILDCSQFDEVDGAAAETATGHTRPDCAGKSAGDIDENIQFAAADFIIIAQAA